MTATLKNYLAFGWMFGLLVLAAILNMYAPLGDWGNYYFGSKFLLEGDFNRDIYETFRFNLAIYDRGYRDFFLSYTAVPPLTAIVYIPFARIEDVYVSKLVWNILTSALFCLTVFRLHVRYRFRLTIIWLLPLIFFFPVRSNIMPGQSYLLIFFLLGEGFLAWEKDRRFVMAFCWGLAILLKIFPAIVLLFLLFRKDYRAAGTVILSMLIMVAASLLLIPADCWLHYATDIFPRLAAGEINDPFTTHYQSMQVLLRRIFVREAMLNPGAPFHLPVIYELLHFLFRLAILSLTLIVTSRKTTETLQSFGAWMLAGTLLSGYGTTYSLILLAFVALPVLQQPISPARKWSILALCFVASSLPVRLLAGFPDPFAFMRLWLLLTLFSLLIYDAVKTDKKAWIACFFLLLPVLLFSLRNLPGTGEGKYLATDGMPFLVYDLQVKGNSLSVSYFDEKGPSVMLLLKDQITGYEKVRRPPEDHPRETIRSPLLINDSIIVYLSDKNRGPGFYAVRKSPAGDW